jgi:hypothetical protein
MEQFANSHPNDESLSRYLHGQISRREAKAIEHHYLACGHCSDRVAILEWFPEIRDGEVAVLNPPVTIRSRSIVDPAAAPLLTRAFESARARLGLLTGSDQMVGASAVAALAVLVLSVSLPITRAQQEMMARAMQPTAQQIADASEGLTAPQFGPPFDDALQLDADAAMVRSIPKLRIDSLETRPVLMARVFIPPAQPLMLARNEPMLPPATPRLALQVNAPAIPYEIPRLNPPRTSRFRSVLRVLARPFVPDRRDRRVQETI